MPGKQEKQSAAEQKTAATPVSKKEQIVIDALGGKGGGGLRLPRWGDYRCL